MSATWTLDDRNSSLIYSPPEVWGHMGKNGQEFNDTTTFTNSTGATVTFHFNGTGVHVFGSVAAKGHYPDGLVVPQTSYSVDGSTPSRYTAKFVEGLAQRQISFYNKTSLSPTKEHTLVINTLSAGFFYLDRIDVDGGPVSFFGDGGNGNGNGSSNGGGHGGGDGDGGGRGSNGDHHSHHDGTTDPTGIILGAVLGTLGLLTLAVAAFLGLRYYRRRSRTRAQIPLYHFETTVPPVPPPSYQHRY